METIMEALPGKLQMISGDGKLLYPEANKFVEELKEISTASSQYTVISIIGPQSSGKSYFLNTLYSTKFDVLDASKGRHQTTKGIWIAKCVKPLMIIMDVEGCDGTERGEDDTLFERQSALFSLTISDVLLLNMWYTDIGRQNGGNFGLIKIIFEERVKIEAPKTTIIILVRDYDYETPVDFTRKKLKVYMNKIWEKVHPTTTNTKMSDYIKVIVKDFPHKKEQQDFAQKCKELSEFLCNLAANGSLEQKTGASTFAYSSQLIWELILENKRLSVADHKLAMSTHVCSVIKDEILNSLDQETEYGSLTSGTSMSVNEFNRELNLFLKTILARYETGTKACDKNIRQNVMVKLQEETLQRFEQTFEDRIESLSTETLSSIKSVVHAKIDNLVELEQSFAVDLLRPYMAEFDDNSSADLNPYFEKVLGRHRKKLQEDFTRIAGEEAYKIQIERDEKKKIELQIELEQKNAKEIQMERDRLKEKEELMIKFEQQKQQELQIERDRFKAKELEMKHDKERQKELQTERDRLKEKELKMDRDRLKEQEEFLIKREQIREREFQLQQETLIKLRQMEQMPPPCTIS